MVGRIVQYIFKVSHEIFYKEKIFRPLVECDEGKMVGRGSS
jgi:hypothetical protein